MVISLTHPVSLWDRKTYLPQKSIHSLDKYLLDTCYVPGTVIQSGMYQWKNDITEF